MSEKLHWCISQHASTYLTSPKGKKKKKKNKEIIGRTHIYEENLVRKILHILLLVHDSCIILNYESVTDKLYHIVGMSLLASEFGYKHTKRLLLL